VRLGRDSDPSPLLMPRSKIELSYTSTLPKGLRGLWLGENYLLLLHNNSKNTFRPLKMRPLTSPETSGSYCLVTQRRMPY
jgi:hypothetical protein